MGMIVHVALAGLTAAVGLVAGWRMRGRAEFTRGWHHGRMFTQASVVSYIDELKAGDQP